MGDYATPPSSPDRDAQIPSSEKTFDDTQTQESQLNRYELMERAAEDSLQMKTPENSPKAKPISPLGNEMQKDRAVQDTFQQRATNQRRRVSEFLFPPARNPPKRKRSKNRDNSSEKRINRVAVRPVVLKPTVDITVPRRPERDALSDITDNVETFDGNANAPASQPDETSSDISHQSSAAENVKRRKRNQSDSDDDSKNAMSSRRHQKATSSSRTPEPKKRQRWDDKEDANLIKGLNLYGMQWAVIKAKLFASSMRTNINLKDRHRQLLKDGDKRVKKKY